MILWRCHGLKRIHITDFTQTDRKRALIVWVFIARCSLTDTYCCPSRPRRLCSSACAKLGLNGLSSKRHDLCRSRSFEHCDRTNSTSYRQSSAFGSVCPPLRRPSASRRGVCLPYNNNITSNNSTAFFSNFRIINASGSRNEDLIAPDIIKLILWTFIYQFGTS